jgi:hypothetical protein
MGDCETARVMIAFGVGLLLLSGLGAAVSWAYAVRVVRASHAAMREVTALRAAYQTHPVEWREAPHPPRDSSPRA